jgi:adiponectin receptor
MPLVSKSQLEGWYLVNSYIYDGYRSPRSPYGALISAFELHNETLSIYTHLLPGIYWLYQALSYNPVTQSFVCFAYLAGAYLGLASAFAHTFNIVDKRWSSMSWKADYTGIIMINLTHQILDTYILLDRGTLRSLAIVLEGGFAAYCIYDIIRGDQSHWRITYPMISSIILTVPAAAVAPSASPASHMSVYSMQCSAFVLLGGAFFVTRIPESLTNPNGIFNLLNSHVLLHLCIVAGVSCAYRSVPFLLQV